MVDKFFTPRVRSYIYEICLAFAPLFVLYGWFADSEIALILGVVKVVLGLGTAVGYRPTKQTNNNNDSVSDDSLSGDSNVYVVD